MIRVLHWSMEQTITEALESMELTSAQGRILGYLTLCGDPPCPSHVEENFQLSHPTVSGLLSRLEQKGFVKLQPDPADKRKKRIHILDKGKQCHQRIHNAILENEERMVADFSAEERELFRGLLQRAIRNLGHTPCQPIPKEETIE